MHEHDHLQNRFLAAGAVGVIVISSVRQSMAFDRLWAQSVQSCLPFSIVLALGISNIYHRIHRRVQLDSTPEPQLEKSRVIEE